MNIVGRNAQEPAARKGGFGLEDNQIGDNDDGGRSVVVALAGNPNVGKSTVFNSLTGLNRHTGNWPGKTVDLFCGMVRFQGSGITW